VESVIDQNCGPRLLLH